LDTIMRSTRHYTFFFRPDAPFSQWHPSRFVVDGNTFVCAEQFMMHGKALLFRDVEIAAQILTTAAPRTQKALGRNVRNFDEAVWKREREAIVYRANHAKFTQNPALLKALLATGNRQLVEASPFDRIWGIGLAADHPDAEVPSKWRGQNLLGKILTRLRDELVAQSTRPLAGAPRSSTS
jgi:ribA/ribD-fused uncharacterized protein